MPAGDDDDTSRVQGADQCGGGGRPGDGRGAQPGHGQVLPVPQDTEWGETSLITSHLQSVKVDRVYYVRDSEHGSPRGGERAWWRRALRDPRVEYPQPPPTCLISQSADNFLCYQVSSVCQQCPGAEGRVPGDCGRPRRGGWRRCRALLGSSPHYHREPGGGAVQRAGGVPAVRAEQPGGGAGRHPALPADLHHSTQVRRLLPSNSLILDFMVNFSPISSIC